MLQQFSSTDRILTPPTFAFIASKSDPDTFMCHDTKMTEDNQYFWHAMNVEIAGLEQLSTCSTIPQSQEVAQNKKIIPRIWIFKPNQYSDGCIHKYKTSFCLCWYKQAISIELFQHYTLVVIWSSVCLSSLAHSFLTSPQYKWIIQIYWSMQKSNSNISQDTKRVWICCRERQFFAKKQELASQLRCITC